MSKPLTAPAVAKLRPTEQRREIPDGGCPGLYLIIQPSGAKSWALRFRRPNGDTAKLVLGTVYAGAGKEPDALPAIGGHLTLAGAHRLVAELRHQIAQGRDPAAMHLEEKQRLRIAAVDAASNTFAAAALQFVDEYTVPKKGRPPRNWTEVARILGVIYSAEGAERFIKGGLADRWRDRPVAEINGHDIYGAIDEARRYGIPGLKRRTEGVSDARGRKVADALSGLFGWLLEHRRITADPSVGVWRPPAPVARDRVLNTKRDVRGADELRWFWAATNEVGQSYGAVLRLLLLTGCRVDEIAEMRSSELNDDRSTLSLPGERTKNGRPHEVPLSQLARDEIAKVRRVEGCAFVFTTNGRTPVYGSAHRIKRSLDDAMRALARQENGKDAAIPPWRIHDLRRTAATGMAGIGVQPHIVEAALNHISGAKAGVAGTYNREAYEIEKRTALERWAAHVASIVDGNSMRNVVPLRLPE